MSAIAKRAANVSWNQGNQRTSSLSIRGIGKIGQTEAQDPSVGVIFDGVSYGYNALTSSFDFVDIDTIEVARGPQGTLQGKNASVGSVTINTKRPSFTPTADYTLAFNKNNGVLGVAAIGGPVIDDLLAWRGTFSVDRQQGPRANAYNRDQTYTNTDRVSGRVQFLLDADRRTSRRASKATSSRAPARPPTATRSSRPTPTTYADGAPNTLSTDAATRLARSWFTNNPSYGLSDYYAGIDNDAQHALVTGSDGLTAELNWKIPSGQTLTSITAVQVLPLQRGQRRGHAVRHLPQRRRLLERLPPGQPGTAHQLAGGRLRRLPGRPVLHQVNNSATYQRAWGNDAGAWFASAAQYATLDATAAGQLLMRDSLANVVHGLQLAGRPADHREQERRGLRAGQLAPERRFTVTTGARLTHENRTNVSSSYVVNPGDGVDLANFASTNVALQDAAAAKYFGAGRTYASLTAAEKNAGRGRTGDPRRQHRRAVRPATAAKPYRPTSRRSCSARATRSRPTSRATRRTSTARRRASRSWSTACPRRRAAEKTNSFELGVKSALLDKTLILNADVFDTRIGNYQQAVQVVDQYTTALKADGNHVLHLGHRQRPQGRRARAWRSTASTAASRARRCASRARTTRRSTRTSRTRRNRWRTAT